MSQNNDCINSMWEEFEKPQKRKKCPKQKKRSGKSVRQNFTKEVISSLRNGA